MTEPFEARSLPSLPADDLFATTIRECATAITGFPHPGDHADALIWTVKWLRANPDKADVLLGRTPPAAQDATETEPGQQAAARRQAVADLLEVALAAGPDAHVTAWEQAQDLTDDVLKVVDGQAAA